MRNLRGGARSSGKLSQLSPRKSDRSGEGEMSGIRFSVDSAKAGATGAHSQGSQALTPQVPTKLESAKAGVKSWNPLRIFSRRSEPQRPVGERFLREALRPAGERSNAKMLGML